MSNSISDQGFFTALPSEIIIDILARLPVRTIISCKSVCKSFLRLIKSDEFCKFHLSKSAPLLAVDDPPNRAYSFFEVEEGPDLRLNFDPVTKVNLTNPFCSVNGLLLFLDKDETDEPFLLCNPITRQYIRIPNHQLEFDDNHSITFGFGASRISGQLKVVRIYGKWQGQIHCEVCTLGTGSWKRIAHADALKYVGNKQGLFLNGNLHWLVQDYLYGYSWISCFDLEEELLTTFSTPDPRVGISELNMVAPLGGHLCICEQDTSTSNIIIWLMKEYRVEKVEKSWIKEFVIDCETFVYLGVSSIHPIKVLNDGGLLILWIDAIYEGEMYYSVHYSGKDRVGPYMFRLDYPFVSHAILHTPSFVSLESFGMEDVRSF